MRTSADTYVHDKNETFYFLRLKFIFLVVTMIEKIYINPMVSPNMSFRSIQTFYVKHRMTGENKLFCYMRNS